ncbi:hypothetical protein BF49_2986 [Bradyrhizobium sp.]|nr:hypothetical protein BF49_2986 [Bradyrhizobium sp.]
MVGHRLVWNRRWRLGWLGSFGLGILQHLIHGFPQLRTRIRAHGTTNSRILRCVCHGPFSFIRTLTVGFGVAPNLLTLPLSKALRKALAGLGLTALTAGGDFHPALRTSAVRNERPDRNMTPVRGRGKRVPHGKTAWSHAAMAVQGARDGISDWRAIESDSDLFFPLIIVAEMSCGRTSPDLWTDSAASCADSANHIS